MAIRPWSLSLALVLFSFSVVFPASPLLSQRGLSTQSESMAGGGVAQDEGSSGLSVNPATMLGKGGWEVEVGSLSMLPSGAPYFIYGQSDQEWAHALEYVADFRDSLTHHLLLVGGAKSLGHDFQIGLTLRSELIGEAIGVDADMGLKWQWRRLRMGSALQRLLESGVGSEPKFYATERKWLGGIGWEPPAFSPSIMPSLDYEMHVPDFSPTRLQHVFSLGCTFFPEKTLTLHMTARVPDSHASDWNGSAGLSTFFRVYRSQVEARYAVANQPQKMIFAALEHSFSIRIHWRLLKDRIPPKVRLILDRPFLSAEEKSQNRPLSFLVNSQDNRGQVKAWKISIHRAEQNGALGPKAHEIVGIGHPPSAIQWLGGGVKNLPLTSGLYLYRLWAMDEDGNEVTSPWQMLEIGPNPPSGEFEEEDRAVPIN